MNEKLFSAPYDIIVLAGQSNAEGYGLGNVTEEYVPDERICALGDRSNPHFVEDENHVNHFHINYPAEIFIEVADEPTDSSGKVGKLALSFAREYVREGLLEKGRKLLIINAAVGGSGFLWGQWRVGDILYRRLNDLLDFILPKNSENRLVAFLWHQGETDVGEHKEWAPEKKYQVHKEYLSAMLSDFLKKYNCKKLPFVAADFCEEWYLYNKQYADPIIKAVEECAHEINGAFIRNGGLNSNNREIGNGDPVHFSREALHKLGKMYFEAYKNIL